MEQLVRFEPGLMIWTWITFFIVMGILARKAWGPMIEALDKRQADIRTALDAADRARAESEQLETKYQEQLQASRKEGQKVLNDARAAAEKLRIELEEAARKKSADLVAKARDQIVVERDQALREIRATVVDLSLSIAGKVVERNLTTQDNRKLVEESLRQIGEA
ncbi:MAG: F0F1 ATP synthase subunit B [Candidatus Marinimicrobia bacterium]|nr:F0F1 ATP synthase subunit B [Candidatus Neomarinimicrobiota bacterium]